MFKRKGGSGNLSQSTPRFLAAAKKRALSIILVIAMALTSFSSFGTVAMAAPDSSVTSVATNMGSKNSVGVPTTDMLSLNKSTLKSVSYDNSYNITNRTISNNTVYCVPSGNTTYTNPLTLHFENVGWFGSSQLGADIKITKITTGTVQSSNISYIPVISISSGSVFFGTGTGDYAYESDCKVEVSYTCTIYYMNDTSKSAIGFPCRQEISDLDMVYSYMTESWEGTNDDYSKYYVWDECTLKAQTSSGKTKFLANNGKDYTGNDSYYYTGVIAEAKKGQFSGTFTDGFCQTALHVCVSAPNNSTFTPTKSITSSKGTGPYNYGDTVSFSIEQKMGTFYSDTFTVYSDMKIMDELPSGLTYVDGSAKVTIGGTDITSNSTYGSLTASGNTVSYTFNSTWLSDSSHYTGQTIKLTLDATVNDNASTTDSSKNRNTGSTVVNGTTLSDTQDISVVGPALSISKSANHSSVKAGGSLRYTIKVKQTTKDATAKNVVVTDTVPSDLTVTGVTADNGATVDWSSGSNSFTVNCNELAYGDTLTIYVDTTVNTVTSVHDITNTAYAKADHCSQVSDRVMVTLLLADGTFSAEKTTDKDTYYVGENVIYTITIHADSGNIYGMFVNDNIPTPYVSFSDWSNLTVKVDGVTLTNNVDYVNETQANNSLEIEFNRTIYEGETVEITYTCIANEPGTYITNHAQVNAGTGVTLNLYAPVDILEVTPKLNISKVADNTEYYPGEIVEYTIELKQTEANATARDVVIQDTLPNNLTYLGDATLSGVDGEVSVSGQKIIINISSLAYNKTATVTLSARVNSGTAGTSITNPASATASNAGSVNDSVVINVLTPDPSLFITKTADKEEYEIGETVTYTIALEQTVGEAIAKNVVITDMLPEELSLLDVTSNIDKVSISKSDNSFTAICGDIDSNTSVSLTVTATANSAGTGIVNTATADADNATPVSDDATININANEPVLTIEKKADATTHNVGETVTYTITVKQTVDGATAENVVVTDTLPDELELDSVTTTMGSANKNSSNGFTVNVGDMTVSDTATITVTATAKEAGSNITNVAYANADNADEVSDNVAITVLHPGLSIVKSANKTSYYVGDTITYTVVVSQTVSGATSTGVTITDTLPTGLTYVDNSASTTKGSVSVSGSTITANIGSLAYGESATITVKAVIGDTYAGGSVSNTARVTDNEGNEEDSTVIVTVAKPDISITKSVSGGPYNVGDEITYTLEVKATDAPDTGVEVSDVIPSYLEDVKGATISGSGNTVSISGNTLTASIPSIGNGDTVTITVKATITADAVGKSVTNTATVTDDYGNNDDDSAEISVLNPNISIVKNVSAGPYNVGDVITYTLTVTETVADAVDFDVEVSDTLPEGLTATGTYTCTSNAKASMEGNTLTATIDELAYGDTVTITIEAQIDSDTYGQTIKNIAVAEDPYGNKPEDDESITVATPSVSIVKTSDKETYDVGDTVTYTIKVTETDPDAIAYDLVVTDDLPAGLTINGKPDLSGADGDVSVDGQSFTVSIDKLTYNQTATITVEATIGESLAGKEFTNIAVVKGPGFDPEEDDVTNDVLMPGVKIDKSVNDSKTYNVRDEVTYTLVVTNPVANSHTTDVVVTDEIPSGLTYVDKSATISGTDKNAKYDVSENNGVITATIDTLASTDTVTITFTATIGASVLDNIDKGATATVTNTAYVTDYYGNTDNSSADIKVIHPDLKVTKSIGDGPFNVGDVIDYTLTLKESVEGAISYDVYLEDDLPEGLSATGHIEVNGVDYDKAYVDGDSYVVSIPVLNYGETATVTVEATIGASVVGQTVDNEVYAWDSYNDNDRADAPLYVEQPTLGISKIADGTWYSVDDTVTYTITVNETTNGAVARNVVVTDTLPDELELINVAADMDGNTISDITTSGNSFTVNAGDMWVNNTVTVTVTAKALTENESIINTAYANADYTEEVNDDWKIAVRRPDIAITKDADAREYYPGDTVTYTVTVENRMGDAEAADPDTVPTAYNVRVWDTVPEELELVSVSDDIGSTFTVDGNYFETSYPTMYYGETHVITVTATAYDVGNKTVDNIAYVVSDTTDELDDYAEIDIIKPIMSIDKEVDNTIHSVGEDVIYTIDVTQTVAGLTAYNVAVNDTIPDELALKDAELEGVEGEVTIDGNSFTVDIPELEFGETAHITVTAEAIAPLDGVKNVAVVTADHADPVEDEVTHDILQPVLDIEKTADASSYNVGDTVTYTIRTSQTTENAVAYNVVVSDTLPEGLQLIDVTTSEVDGVVSIGGQTTTSEDTSSDGTEAADEDTSGTNDSDTTGSSTASDNSFTVTYESLSDTDAYITVTALVTGDVADSTITNVATVTANNANPVDDDADIYVMQPILTIEKTADKEKYFVGDTAEYTITVTQTTTNATAYDVVVADDLPDGLKLIDVVSEDGEVAIDGDSFTVSYDAVSDTKTITMTAEVLDSAANQTINNVATVTSSNTDPADDDADIYVMRPELSIDKTSDKETYNTGETAVFTIKITQTVENAEEENVIMTDALPDGLTITGTPEITGVEGGISVDGNTVTASIPELIYGEDATVTIQATVGDEIAGKSVTNTAYVSGDHTDEISDDATINVNEPEVIGNVSNTPKTTKTGQSMAPIIAVVIACIAAAAVIVIVVRRRRIVR